MMKPLSLPKLPPRPPGPHASPGGGASSPSPERIKEALKEANDPARLTGSSTAKRL